MAGASIELTIANSAELAAAFRALQQRLENMTPFFQDIGEALLNSTRERFRSQTAPDGTPWASLSPAYQSRKKKNQNLILTLNGYLRGTLNVRAGPREVRIGTPLIYGATHQFGRPEKNIPARPFLGLAADDETMILDALQDWLTRV